MEIYSEMDMTADEMLEVLEMYIDMTEKQDDIIHKMSSIIARQATELAHLRSIMNYETRHGTE